MTNHCIAKIGLILATLLLANSCSIQGQRQLISKKPKGLQGQIFLSVEMPQDLRETYISRDRKVLKDTVREFSKLHPQVQVFVNFLPTEKILNTFELRLERGAGPDLVLVYYSPKILWLINTGAFRAIDESEIDRSQFRPEALQHVRYQDKLYGLPVYLLTQVLCYNKDKVRELPRTLPELIKQARRGYSVGVHSGFAETFWGTGIFGGQPFDARGRFNLAQGGAWAKWMQWLKRAQNEPNFILTHDAEALQQAFVEGKLAYLTCSSSWIPYFSEALGKDKLGATLLPGEADQSATPVLRTGALLFSRASNPNQAQIALELAQFLTNVEQQNKIEAAIPFIPSNKNVRVNGQLFPLRATLLEQSRTALAVPLDDAERVESIVEYGDIFYQQVLAGEITPSEAATQFTLTINRQFGRQ